MVSADVDTDAALEALEFPVDAIVDCAAIRTALFEAALAADAATLAPKLSSASDTALRDGRTTLLDRAKVGLAAEASAAESGCITAGVDATDVGDTPSDVARGIEPGLGWVVWGPPPRAPRGRR